VWSARETIQRCDPVQRRAQGLVGERRQQIPVTDHAVPAMERRPDLAGPVVQAVAAERRSARRGSPERFEKDSFQRRVADRYEELLSRDDIGPVTVIDSHLNPDEVESSIWAVVEPVLDAWEVPR
ncbi:MAG: hypothetical protein AAFX94_21190, partial [Myxococcota bacterium]